MRKGFFLNQEMVKDDIAKNMELIYVYVWGGGMRACIRILVDVDGIRDRYK